MTDLIHLFEEILNENPNQAIKYLKEKNLDPESNPRGKSILDNIINITKGDGYTFLLTKFHLNERMPLDDIRKLHNNLKSSKLLYSKLPKPVVNYETYRELAQDIERMLNKLSIGWLSKQLSKNLQTEIEYSNQKIINELSKIAKQFKMLDNEKQRFFMKKAFGYINLSSFMKSIKMYIHEVNNNIDYGSIKEKIKQTEDAYLVYDNPEKNILIVHINSLDAMRTLACTSAWCIAKDMVRYRHYRTGGKQYFLIWDYNYPIKNPNFFIATAYNPTDPEASVTHEHTDDSRIDFTRMITEKKLELGIFNTYIEKFKEYIKSLYSESNPIVTALKNGDTDSLLEMIENCELLSPFNPDPYVKSTYPDVEVDIGITVTELKELLEIDDDFSYILSSASDHYYGYEADTSELSWMHGSLNDENIGLVGELAKLIGDNEMYNTIQNHMKRGERIAENQFNEFFEKYGIDNITDDFLGDYGNAQNAAEHRAALEILAKIPIDIDKTTFKITTMWDYYVENNLTAKTFDELLTEIKNNLPSMNSEELTEARYTDLDLDELNNTFRDNINKLIEDIEFDKEDIHYFKEQI